MPKRGRVSTKFRAKVNTLMRQAANAGDHEKYQKKIDCYDKILTMIDEDTSRDPSLADLLCQIYQNMAIVYQDGQDYSQALHYCDLAEQAIQNTEYDTRIPDVWETRGCVYHEQKAYSQAVEALHKSLQLKMQIFEYCEHHIELVPTYERLGDSYQDLGKTDEALKFFQKELDALVNNDTDPSEIATTYNKIAYSLQEEERYEEALAVLQNALEIEQEIFQHDDEGLRRTYQNMTHLYIKLGRQQEADKMLNQCIDLE
ncbi:uncharacterized protein TRIADDRAFT_60716 [Trichoplax adhaerens]|uniref:Uncharacterized protein n=1 Tax=Trichoplax adhaerens TaxID=10228 RepID=B3S967_TRIAD|nr:hypothetical protein TRIADDRAFT_60716 [Trichoplax adhaerens]EDV20751.1 hypothetical protein TRIADDRAFT_60716 [Trichoplax adhaerens]|eukprot:XP_002116692.1 hypothetical protein TRIADDRAFT_60716 [Trichoplax adhaerens]